ncbi:MAG: porin family protein [Ignavibacteriales bacterium]|nr:porin family protein [Ignavibacteriales bacterium]
MKNFFLTLALMLLIGIDVSQAQTVTESWALGFGLKYPRYASVNITSMNFNYGAYLSIQKNFSEHVGMRLKGGFANIKGEWTDALMNNIKQTTNVISADLDMVYYVVPCAPVSPYVFAGAGGNYKMIKNGQSINSDNKLGTQLNVGLGAEFKISPSWSFVAEYTYSVTNNSELDGTTVPTEINGRDSYIALSAGFNYFFDKGAPSPQCEPCQGIQGVPPAMKDMTDYKRIEDLIKRHITKEVTKEVVVDRYMSKSKDIRIISVLMPIIRNSRYRELKL